MIGVSLVPDQVAANQAAFYLNQLTTYGMPLETNAGNLNKVAWLFYLPAWLDSYPVAAQLMSRNVAYINDTPSLVPYGDRYNTSTGVEVSGIEAHPTLGAVFALLAAGVTLPIGTAASAPPTSPPTVTAAAAPVTVKVTSTPRPKPTLTISITGGGLKLTGTDVSVHLHGSKAARCHGSLELVYTHEVTLKHHRRKRVSTVIGHASYSVPAGSSRTVKIKLTAQGLRLLRNATPSPAIGPPEGHGGGRYVDIKTHHAPRASRPLTRKPRGALSVGLPPVAAEPDAIRRRCQPAT